MRYLPRVPMVGFLLGGKVEFSEEEKQELHNLCNGYMIPDHRFPELYEYIEKWATKCTTFNYLKFTLHSHLWCEFWSVRKYMELL